MSTPSQSECAAWVWGACSCTSQCPDESKGTILAELDRSADEWDQHQSGRVPCICTEDVLNATGCLCGSAVRDRYLRELGKPSTPGSALSRLSHAVCPGCGEDRFIGHGPLCLDCYTNPPETRT